MVTELYTKILKEFKSHNLNIINEGKLIEYIHFCISNNQKKHTKFETSHHHILPQAKLLPFDSFKNLKENQWNGTYLNHKNHYTAHYLLSQAIEHISIVSSFCAMNNQGVKYNRLHENDLIDANEFGTIMTRSKKLISEQFSKIEENGKSLAQNQGLKTAETRLRKDPNSFKKSSQKRIDKLTKEKQKEMTNNMLSSRKEVGEDGLTSYQRSVKKGNTSNFASKFIIYNNYNKEQFICEGNFKETCINNNLPLNALRESLKSGPIFQSTRKEVISRHTKTGMIKYKGWYAEKID